MSKKSFLDSIRVKTPCQQNWNEMRGNDQIRFCDHCAKDVNNLSQMTRKQARKVVAQSNGNICIRYIRRPDGRIQTIKNTFHQITRQTGIAAGILGTSLSVSTVAYAQGEINPSNNFPEKTKMLEVDKREISEPKEPETAVVSGTVTDPNGAVIPATNVFLINEKTNVSRTATTNDEGFYEFKNVSTGNYKLKIYAVNFKSKQISSVVVENGNDIKMDSSLELDGEVAVVGDMVFVEYEHTLFNAVSNDDLEEVKLLIAKGENVNAKDKSYNGITALFVAVENGNLEIVETLLNAGAKVNARDKGKRTPLMNLDSDATLELVNLLLRHGAKSSAVDKQGNTALHYIAGYGDAEVARILINDGANIDAQNKEGATALMNAVEEENFEVVKVLLEAGADTNLKNKKGESVFDLVSEEKIKGFLIAYGGTGN